MDLLRRENFFSNEPLEKNAAYSQAVKIGDMVFIGGTAATNARGDVQGGADPYRQTKIILQKIEQLLQRIGTNIRNVIRVRMHLTDIGNRRHCLRAYSEYFRDIKPVITVTEVNALARVDRLVEVEADAVIGSYLTSRLT
jgi:enamine deaminase RidA (YjgF/YER057c/UK114 family)